MWLSSRGGSRGQQFLRRCRGGQLDLGSLQIGMRVQESRGRSSLRISEASLRGDGS